MSDPPEPANPHRTARSIIAAVVLRVVLAAVFAAVLFAVFGDIGAVLPQRPVRPPSPEAAMPVHVDRPADAGWPHRRGPHYNAVSDETDLADAWPAEGPPVLWTLDLGRGYSGFTAMGNRVFTQTQTLSAQFVLCLDADTGEEIWRRRYDWPYDPSGMYPGPRATPTWHAGCIYYAGPRGRVGCLTADDGRLIWEVNINEEFAGRGTDFGYACSPTIEDGKVVMPVGGKGASVVALDARDGSTVWASGDEPASYCSALPITFAGHRYIVAFLQNALALFDLKTGRLVWQDNYSQGYDEHAAAPLYEDPYLMIACPFKSGAECYKLELADQDAAETSQDKPPKLNVTNAWFSREMSNDTASSVVVDGHVYGFDLRDVQAKAHRPSRGTFKCMEFTTGKVLWESNEPGHATVLVADGKLFLFNDEGELILARANPERYEELARTQVFSGETCWTAPSLCRGRLYLRSPSKAACVYVGKPENLERKQTQQAVAASEIPQSKPMDLAKFLGGEREYAQDPPELPELWMSYLFGLLGVLAPAGVLAVLVDLFVRIKWREAASPSGRATLWIAAFLLGVFGTPIYNRLVDYFVFTWPICLAVAHQATLNAVVRSNKEPKPRWAKWLALLATAFFIAVCIAYYLACRRLSLPFHWIFLLGFFPSWPIAVPAAYKLQHPGHPIRDFLWAAASFTLFYWSAASIIWVKTTVM